MTIKKTTKKAATKKKAKPKKDEHIAVTVNSYGTSAMTTAYDRMINQMIYGDPVPEESDKAAIYWKDKYELASKRADQLKSQVDLLTQIINSNIGRGNDN